MLKMLENAVRLVDGVDAGLSRVMQSASRILKNQPRPLEPAKNARKCDQGWCWCQIIQGDAHCRQAHKNSVEPATLAGNSAQPAIIAFFGTDDE